VERRADGDDAIIVLDAALGHLLFLGHFFFLGHFLFLGWGSFLFLSGYRPKIGLMMALVSGVWFLVLRFGIMDHVGSWWFPSMYKSLWAPGESGFRSVAKTLVSNPLFVIDQLLIERKVYYLLHLLVPIAFLPARRWYLWAAFLPGGLLTLLATDYKPPTMFTFQYVMHWAPYLFAAVPVALAAIARRPDAGPVRARAAVGAMLFASAVLTYNYGAFPAREKTFRGGYSTIEFFYNERERERYAELQEIIRHIPADAKVAATERVGPHVSSRKTLYAMRNGPHDADYILAWKRQLKMAKTLPTLRAALVRGEFGVFKRVGEFALFKRGHDTSDNRQLMTDWRL
jgi:hypothetical protein